MDRQHHHQQKVVYFDPGSYNDLKNPESQLLATHGLIDAISGIRGTLPPVKSIGPDFGSGFKWSGGSLAPDGRIFFAPHASEHVLYLNPFDGTISKFGAPILPISKLQSAATTVISRKFSDVVLGPNGLHLYLVPASAKFVIKMSLSTGAIETLGADLGNGEWKWGSGVLFGDKIYCSPHNANSILMIDCLKSTVSLIGDDFGTKHAKWGSPVVVPLTHTNIKKKLFHTSEESFIKQYLQESGDNDSSDDGNDDGDEDNNSEKFLKANYEFSKSSSGVVILFPPLNASHVLALNTKTKETSLIGHGLGADTIHQDSGGVEKQANNSNSSSSNDSNDLNFKYEGGCLGADGAVYCAPCSASQFLRIEVQSRLVMVEEEDDCNEIKDCVENDDGDANCAGTTQNWRSDIHRMKLDHNLEDGKQSRSKSSATQVINNMVSSTIDAVKHRTSSSSNSKATLVGNQPPRTSDRARSTSQNSKLRSISGNSPHQMMDMIHTVFPTSPHTSPHDHNERLEKKDPQRTRTRCMYQWPPNIVCTRHGVERMGKFKFGATVLSADGRTAIGVPMNASAFLCIDTAPNDGVFERHVHRLGSKLRADRLRFGGAVLGVDGYLYCSPLNATQVLRFDTLALSPHKEQHLDLDDGKQNKRNKNVAHTTGRTTYEDDNEEEGREGVHKSMKKKMKKKTHQVGVKGWHKTSQAMFNVFVLKHKKAIASKGAKSNHPLSSSSQVNQSNDSTQDEIELYLGRNNDDDGNIDVDDDDDEAIRVKIDQETNIPPRNAMVAIAAYVHWRKFATRKARERQGYSASDRLIGNNDKAMKSLILHEPDIWCYGLTVENSSIAGDLCDWLAAFAETESGTEFMTTCGMDATHQMIARVAGIPNLIYSLISLEKHDILMKLPLIRKTIIKPDSFRGDWLIRCLASKKLMKAAVSFIEIVSEDIHDNHIRHVQSLLNDNTLNTNEDDSDDDNDDGDGSEKIMKNKTFQEIASIDHFVTPMLRLPTHLQDRVVSTKLMGAVLDELFTERPLALLVMSFDFFFIGILLTLLIRATWHVQHPGGLDADEYGVVGSLLFFNFIYILREYINYRATSKLGLPFSMSKSVDILSMLSIFAIIVMTFFPEVRVRPPFIAVAAAASGLCWLKLLNFISVIHLKFAVYIEALKLITKSLRIFVLTLFIYLSMFANMFFVLMKSTGYGVLENDDPGSIYDKTFTHVTTSYLTLFRMLLGDFDMEWFRRDGEELLTVFAIVLFVICNTLSPSFYRNIDSLRLCENGYVPTSFNHLNLLNMVGVFIILLNVLIAVVCDSYSEATNEAHEIFLRTRLQTVAHLDMQGLTKLRSTPKNDSHLDLNLQSGGSGLGGGYGSIELVTFSTNNNTRHHHQVHANNNRRKEQGHVQRFFESFALLVDYCLKDSVWHYYMRQLLAIGDDLNNNLKEVNPFEAVANENDIKTIQMIKNLEDRILMMEDQQQESESRIMEQIKSAVDGLDAKITASVVAAINTSSSQILEAEKHRSLKNGGVEGSGGGKGSYHGTGLDASLHGPMAHAPPRAPPRSPPPSTVYQHQNMFSACL